MIHEIDTEPQRQPDGELNVRKILITEDDVCQMEILEFRFSQQGFQVIKAQTGQQAMELAAQHLPDAILMDVDLPDMSGMELCRKLTDADATADIPIVILSGSTDQDIVRQARSAGSSFFLHKPFDPTALLLLVTQAIEDAKQWI
ncbi:response regulator [bacterium]|nr:response regulator [bacterium]